MSEAEETPTQRQARLRRERRNAKLQAGGSQRLASIMNSSGRQHAADAEAARPITPASQPVSPPAEVGDPGDMDIAEHHYQPRRTGSGFNTPPVGGFNTPPIGGFAPGAQAQQMPPSDDPMMQMLQQMMAGGGGPGGPGGANAQFPPGLANLFGAGGMPGMPGLPGQDQAEQQAATSSSAYIWRILHFFISLLLSLYVAFNTTFNGSKRARDLSTLTYNSPISLERNFTTQLFYLFATAEVVLQSSRYFIEKGQLSQGGILGTLSQVLPEPWAGYLRVVGRYSVIYTTVVADAMVVVFVLGAMAWWRGGLLGETVS